MIPASHWHDNGDGTAWRIMDHDYREGPGLDPDRPCDTCGGQTRYEGDNFHCPDCSGTGRHTFTVEVETFTVFDASDGGRGIRYEPSTHRVSVVPGGMVLPIVDDVGPVPSETHIRITGGGIAWLAERIEGGGWRHTEITLPPAAAPGMWAVKLAVQS
jgi:hypothetical protein